MDIEKRCTEIFYYMGLDQTIQGMSWREDGHITTNNVTLDLTYTWMESLMGLLGFLVVSLIFQDPPVN